MAHSKSARKRIRTAERDRLRNRVYRSGSRTLIRRAVEAIESGDTEAASEAVQQAVSMLDRTARKGIIHKNTAARQKSRLMTQFNELKASA